MDQSHVFFGGVGGLLGGAYGICLVRLLGTGFDYRGILWRRPMGYVSQGPIKDAVMSSHSFNYYYNHEGFAAVARPILYVLEGGCLIFVAAGAVQLVGWLLGQTLKAF